VTQWEVLPDTLRVTHFATINLYMQRNGRDYWLSFVFILIVGMRLEGHAARMGRRETRTQF